MVTLRTVAKDLGLQDANGKTAGSRCVVLTGDGTMRVPDAVKGMTFFAEAFTHGSTGLVAHVRDYRYPQPNHPYQIWSISADSYFVITD